MRSRIARKNTRTLEGSMTPEAFEKVIVLFVRTVRYWKE